MELDQDFFSYILRFGRRRKERALNKKKELFNFIELKSIKDSLSIFASAIFDLPIEIRETPDYPYKSGNKLFLPGFYAICDSKENNLLTYHLLILNLFGISKLIKPLTSPLTLELELVEIQNNKINATDFLSKMFPNYLDKLKNVTDSLLEQELKDIVLVGFDSRSIWGRLPRMTNMIDGSNTTPEMREALPEGATERQSKSRGEIKKVEFDENKENIGQDVFHHFEKVETAEEFKGIQRETDGADELAAHADALDDLNLEEVIRSSKSAKSLYKTELDMGFEIADLKEEQEVKSTDEVFSYDEWDEKNRIYKKDWCRIIHTRGELFSEFPKKGKLLGDSIQSRQTEILKLKKKLIQLTSLITVQKKLLNGPDIDIDNVIRNASIRKSGGSGDQRYYQETKKRHRDMACMILVDTSLSSDSWVQNKRILDVALEAILIFGEASKDLGDPLMIAGFNSNTRHDCKFIEWKSFTDPWINFTKKIDHIVPAGYTRIGPAIRHANYLLTERPERHKLLLILTDGRPTDFDRYEGTYGLSDVRQAIRESDTAGVVAFALAVDPTAKQFLPKLFGLGNFQILHNMETLPESLAKLYTKMSKRK